MFASLIAKFAGVPTWARYVAAVVALIALLGMAKCSYDRGIIKDHDADVTAETVKTDGAAKEKAAEERGADKATIDKAEKDRSDAINQATDGKPSDASIRLNCERLRRAGKDTSRIAACAGLGR
jgi:hypothetical protein